jgi:ATP-binding cassette subfamily B protein/subfamily B ATP-binding cassette protein MsbA
MFVFGYTLTVLTGTIPFLATILFEVWSKSQTSVLDRILTPHVLELFPFLVGLTRDKIAVYLPFAFPVLYGLIGLVRYTHYILLNNTAERITAGLRVDMVRKIMRLNLTYHGSLERGSGGLISRVFSDTTLLQQGLNFYVDLLREPVQLAVFVGMMLFLDWKLTVYVVIFLPFFLIVTKQVSRSLRKYGTFGRESMEDLTATLKESVDGIRVVQSFNLEQEMEGRFARYMKTYLRTAKSIIKREQAVSPFNEFMISFLVAAFAYYSINQVLFHGGDGAAFIGFFAAAGLMQESVKKLQDANVKIQQSIVANQRIFSLIDSSSEVPESASPRRFPSDWKTITFKNVSFAYAGELTLKNVNLTIRRGEHIALVGESGSGKSTLVNLLERFYDPTEGEILIDETPISQIALRDLRHNIALVTQDVFLFRDTIARNIQAGDFTKNMDTAAAHDPALVRQQVETSAKLANAHGFISATPQGYENQVGERGSFLSGGEKQRVSIARAIYKDAPILILDEATSALDSVSEMEVQKGLHHLMEGRTAFVIAHRLSTVFNADRILVMKKGEIVEQGTHASLLEKQGEYHRFFQLQAGL